MSRRFSKPSPEQDLDQKLRKVYDDINRLADQLARVGDSARRRTDGKEGDLRLVRDKTNDGYELEGRFKEGYVRVGKATEQDKRLASLEERFDTAQGNAVDPRFSSPWMQIGEISITVLVGTITGLFISGIENNILAGEQISVENIVGGLVIDFTLASDYLTASSLGLVEVEAHEVYLPIHVGSKVYLKQ